MNIRFQWLFNVVVAAVVITVATGFSNVRAGETALYNVSYDPTREFYQDYNAVFSKYWLQKKGDNLTVKQSHGGSGKQSRAVIDGQPADVVTLALSYDIDAIAAKSRLVSADWKSRLPNNSAPYTSTIVFLVRKGNPKGVHDWEDLIKPNVVVVTPNPKTGGGARWNYLAAYGYKLKQAGGDVTKANEFMKALFKNVPVLDTGARGATTTFVKRELGDVLITWENEALLTLNDAGGDQYEIVTPSISILCEPSVAWVDRNNKRNGTAEVAKAYLEYLYSPEGQEIAARHYYRPRLAAVAARYEKQFPKMNLITVDEFYGGWANAQKNHFADGGTFDRIFEK